MARGILVLVLCLLNTDLILTHREGSCAGRCGAPLDRARECQCDSDCSTFEDCCDDYTSSCTELEQGSCVDRCGDHYDPSLPCHCDTLCEGYRNCCDDYITQCLPSMTPEESCAGRCGLEGQNVTCNCHALCVLDGDCCRDHLLLCLAGHISNEEILSISEEMWSVDSYGFRDHELRVNIQNMTNTSNSIDMASERLFSYVDERVFRYPSYSLFIDLLDNYNLKNGEIEPNKTETETAEVQAFIDHVVTTHVMSVLKRFLESKKRLDRYGDIKQLLERLWFTDYPRSSKLAFSDSSGFEHVFVGEHKSANKVNGFHNWVQMYLLEKEGRINYQGYNGITEPQVLESRFTWDGVLKKRGSLIMGVSPEFDMALYTLCILARSGGDCRTRLDGNIVYIGTYDVGHIPGLQVATAFPKVGGPD